MHNNAQSGIALKGRNISAMGEAHRMRKKDLPNLSPTRA